MPAPTNPAISPPTGTLVTTPFNKGLPLNTAMNPMVHWGGIGAGTSTGTAFGANPQLYIHAPTAVLESQTASAATGSIPASTGAPGLSPALIAVVLVAAFLFLVVK